LANCTPGIPLELPEALSHSSKKMLLVVGHPWLRPVILVTQEAEIRKIVVQSQPEQIVRRTLSLKNHHKKKVGGMAQGIGPEFKTQYQAHTKMLLVPVF
jgi:hypothetical protein